MNGEGGCCAATLDRRKTPVMISGQWKRWNRSIGSAVQVVMRNQIRPLVLRSRSALSFIVGLIKIKHSFDL